MDFARVVEEDGDGLIVLDREFRYTYLNPMAERLLGASRGELLGRAVWEVYPSAVGTSVHSAMVRAMEERVPTFCEYPSLLRPDSWYEVRCLPHSGGGAEGREHRNGGILVYVRDVTERHAAEQERERLVAALSVSADALQRSEERLRLAADAAGVGVWEFDPATGAAVWDWRARAMAGFAASGPLDYDRFLARVHDEDRDRVHRVLLAALDPHDLGEPFHIEFRMAAGAPDAVTEPRWLLADGRAHFDADAKPKRLVGVLVDVTERRVAEARLRASVDALRESEERYRSLVDATAQVVWTNSPEGRMVGEQPGWAALTGQTSEEYQGFGWADAVHPDDRQPTVEEWDRCVRECATFDWEHRVRRRDGVYRTFSIRAVPVRDPDGSLREWVGVHTDVTERRERERRERFLSDLNERTRALLTDPDALAWEVVSSVGAFLGLSRFMYADVDVGAGSLSVLRDWCQGEGVDSVAGTWPLAPWGSGVLADLSAGRTVVNRDYLTDARTAGAHETIYEETDIRANVTVPCLRGGEWVGVFSAQMCGAPRDWTDDEVELLETVAQRMWLSLENARLYQAAGQARTAAEEAADRMRFGLEAARMVAWDWDLAAVSDPVADLEAAPVRAYLSGAIMGTAADFLGRLHADDRGRVREVLAAAVADPDAETYEIEFRVAGRGEGYERGCRWMAARGHIWRDPASGRALRISGVRWDVDEAKRAEEERAALAAKHEKIAETLQRSLLLTPREDAFSGLSVATVYEAAWDEALIGGDFVDVLAVDEGRIALVVGDVTGKGLRSATYTAEIKFVLRAFLRESANPARAMYRLNQFLLEGKRLDPDPHDAYLALAVAVLDTRTGELSCSCAGMEPCLVLRGPTAPDGSVARAEEVGTIGPLLGMGEESDYGAATTTVAVGDVVAMTTDGVTEARRGKAEFFGLDGLALSAAGAIRSAPSLKDAARAVVADALAFAGGRQQDDVCLLLAQRCG